MKMTASYRLFTLNRVRLVLPKTDFHEWYVEVSHFPRFVITEQLMHENSRIRECSISRSISRLGISLIELQQTTVDRKNNGTFGTRGSIFSQNSKKIKEMITEHFEKLSTLIIGLLKWSLLSNQL